MKLKTKKTLAKRIKVTSKGKLLRNGITGNHLRIKMSGSRMYRKNRDRSVSVGFTKSMKRMLPGS